MDKIQINIENNVTELLNKFKSNQYKQYKDFLNEASSVETNDSNSVKIYVPSGHIYIYKCPKYSNVYSVLETLYSQYNNTITESLCNGTAYNKELSDLLQHILTLHYYLIKVNMKTDSRHNKYVERVKEIEQNMLSEKDKDYFKLWEEMKELAEKIKYLSSKTKIDYVIDVLPELLEQVSNTNTKEAKKRQARKKDAQPENKDVKFPFNKLPVKLSSIEECNSRSRSKKYYISLKDLLLSIEKDDELKRIFGPRFKQLSKKDICSIMFNKKN